MKNKNILQFIIALICFNIYAQQFDEIANLQGLIYGEAKWIPSYTVAGTQLIMAGYDENYNNTAGGHLFLNGNHSPLSITIEQFGYASVDRIDVNKDGYTDFIVTGADLNDNEVIHLYINDGSDQFTQKILPHPGITTGKLRVKDFDGDGYDDFIITGMQGFSYIAKLYINDGNENFVEETTPFFGNTYGDITIFDANNDSYPDVLLTGFNDSATPDTKLYLNNGNAYFSEQTSAGLPGIYFSATNAGDYDNDGDLDILMTGFNTSYMPYTAIYNNDGQGNFSIDNTINLKQLYWGVADFIDYNNDGLMDIFLTGTDTNNDAHAILYTNTNGSFTLNPTSTNNLSGTYISSSDWFDIDIDGDLDLVLTGLDTKMNAITKVYENKLDPNQCNGDLPGTTVGDTECISFTYQGNTVEYTSVRAADGNVWLQQNLGSKQIASTATDTDAFGDLFQWGRWDDGHQLRNSSISTTTLNPNNPIGLNGGTSEFYSTTPSWWKNGASSDTWEAETPTDVTSTNGCDPCKELGDNWRLPTEQEWQAVITAENITDIPSAFSSNLKLTVAGARGSNGIYNDGAKGYYWSKTPSSNSDFAKYVYYSDFIVNASAGGYREQGASIRCIYAQPAPCDAPTALILNQATTTTANINFTASADASNGYEWLLMPQGNTPDLNTAIQNGTIATGNSNVNITGLTPNTGYSLYIKSDCTTTTSQWSTVLDFSTLAETCEAPTALVINQATTTIANISFTASADASNGYEWLLMPQGNTPDLNTAIQNGTIAAGNSNVNITGLTPNTGYSLYIKSNCTTTTSQWSTVLDFSTLAETCEAPTALVANQATTTTANISFTASADASNGYEWLLMPQGNTPDLNTAIQNGTIAAGNSNVNITGLTPTTNYSFYIKSNCANNSSQWTSPFDFSTQEESCEEPISLKVENIYEGNVAISWIEPNETSNILFYKWLLVHKNDDPKDENKILHQGQVTVGHHTLNLSGVEKGNYVLYLSSDCGSLNSESSSIPFTIEALGLSSDNKDLAITIYPNPTNNQVHIDTNSIIQQIKLYSLNGRLIKTLPIQKNQYSLSLAELANGMYILKIYTQKSISVKRLVKK